MHEPLTAGGLLLGAAQLVLDRGLAKGCPEDEDGCLCVTRALLLQVNGPGFLVPWWEDPEEPMPEPYALALMELGHLLGWPSWWGTEVLESQVIAWNDAPDTTAQSAAMALGSAAAICDRRGSGPVRV